MVLQPAQRSLGVAGQGRLAHGGGTGHHVAAGTRIPGTDQGDRLPSPAKYSERAIAVAVTDRGGEVGDVTAEPPGLAQQDDPTAAVAARGGSGAPTFADVRPLCGLAGRRSSGSAGPPWPGDVDRRRGKSGQPGHQVGEHGAGLDRRQLVGITDQNQPGVRAQRLQQPGHHGQ